MFSYYLYVLVFVVLSYFSILESRLQLSSGLINFLAFTTLTLLALIAGTRFKVGTDYNSYWAIFNATHPLEDYAYNLMGSPEIGIILLMGLIKSMGGSYFTFIFLWAAIQSFLLFILLRMEIKKPNLAILIYFTLFYFSLNFNIIRQGMAILLFAFAYVNFCHGNKTRACLYISLSCCFHHSAILLVPFLWIRYLNLNIRKILIILFTVLILLICIYSAKSFFSDVFTGSTNLIGIDTTRYDAYLANTQHLNIFAWLFYDFITLFLLWILRFCYLKYKPYFNMVFIGVCLQIILLPFGPFVERISLYFMFFLVILIPQCAISANKPFYKIGLQVFLFLYLAGYFSYSLIHDESGSLLYNSFLFSVS